jgi:hypothetical protein
MTRLLASRPPLLPSGYIPLRRLHADPDSSLIPSVKPFERGPSSVIHLLNQGPRLYLSYARIRSPKGLG